METTLPVGGRAEHQIVKNGGIRRDTNAASNHHGHFELVPILVAASKGTFNADLKFSV